jgi:Nif-specific regulatory protein
VERERRDLKDERDQLRRTVRGNFGFDNMVGHTTAMRRVFEMVRQVAKWNTTVLVRGESGTGKELIAQAIHYNSPRANGAFVKLNCAALPDNLLESELFGHEKGAFTGAAAQRKGRFEQAHGGTIFLDEIGEISPTFQAKLLRVLQEGEFERVGSNQTIKVDVRVIAATNRDLESAVEKGEFREDLYYRLNVMPIQVPALRERAEDIPALAQFLVQKISRAQGRELSISESAVRLLMRHDWPGNVRELRNNIERLMILAGGDPSTVITAEMLPEEIGSNVPLPVNGGAEHLMSLPLREAREIFEREYLLAQINRFGGNISRTAEFVGMERSALHRKLRALGVSSEHRGMEVRQA